MEILNCTLLQPAYVKVLDVLPGCSHLLEHGIETKKEMHEYNMFVYIDHIKKDIVLVDADGWTGPQYQLRKAIYDYVTSKRRPNVVPNSPQEGFAKMRPETYINNEEE